MDSSWRPVAVAAARGVTGPASNLDAIDPVAAGIGIAALTLSLYNAVHALRKDRRDAARDVASLQLAVTHIEDRHTGEVHGVLIRVSNPGHRPVEIRRYEVSDHLGEVLNVTASGKLDLPATLSDGQGLDFRFDLDDLHQASRRAQAMPEVFRVIDAHGTNYVAELH